MIKRTYISLAILIVVFSCQKAKKTGKQLIEKTEIADASKKSWKKSVDFAFSNLSTTEKTTLSEIYPHTKIPNIVLIENVKINFPSNFYSCYFKYRAEKQEILTFLSELNTTLPNISDENYEENDGKEIRKNLDFIETKMSDYKEDISFFYEINKIEKIEFYRCNKYPNSNYLAVDVKKGIIYHLIENYWD